MCTHFQIKCGRQWSIPCTAKILLAKLNIMSINSTRFISLIVLTQWNSKRTTSRHGWEILHHLFRLKFQKCMQMMFFKRINEKLGPLFLSSVGPSLSPDGGIAITWAWFFARNRGPSPVLISTIHPVGALPMAQIVAMFGLMGCPSDMNMSKLCLTTVHQLYEQGELTI